MKKDIQVLIVEDDPLVSRMLQGMLAEIGYNTAGKAMNGLQAIDMVQSLRPDVLLMDIKMPDMDGLEATRRIYEHCPTPVVVVTAYDTPELLAEASQIGVGAYLVKPPNAGDMERAITIAMARFSDMMTLRRLNAELQEALAKIKTLKGLLPICASCKKIRDDEGYWHQIEVYIRDHSEAEFSHGLCPDCSQKLYPNLYKDK